MNATWRWRLTLLGLVAFAAWWFTLGITWGLPSRAVDPYLFGDREPWSGEKTLELAGGRPHDSELGADVDRDPLAKGDRPILLNETDEQRAAIILRYRLYTYQPDEMITMMALASMRPGEGDFDPKLYQYGGLWIYPVGALLKLASVCGAITLTPDLAFYLDHPEAFGKFYVAARLYVVAWAMVGVWAVFWITHRLSGSRPAAAVAALCYILMPVVVNMAHEAKPHLPAAVLMLLAVVSAMRYVETGRRRWWLGTGALCGAAFGMVLSALPIFIVVPVMTLLRDPTWRERVIKTGLACLVGGAVYAVSNPYILINALTNREVLQSNFGNSLAMYEIARVWEGFLNAARLIGEGTSSALAIVGATGLLVWACHGLARRANSLNPRPREDKRPRRLIGVLATPALLITIQFVALAAGKPGEYGRFAVFPDVVLGVSAIVSLYRFVNPRKLGLGVAIALIAVTALSGEYYLRGFIRDSRPNSSRDEAAATNREMNDAGATAIGVIAEPAPYVMPPVDLFDWKIFLVGTSWPDKPEDVILDVYLVVDLSRNVAVSPSRSYRYWTSALDGKLPPVTRRISWANRHFDVWVVHEKAPS